MRLGNDQTYGEIYETTTNYWRIILPRPIVTGAIIDPTFPVGFPAIDTPGWHMFREDHFDPITRIRRGRFYVPSPGQRPSPQRVLPRLADDTIGGNFEKSLFVYNSLWLPPGAKPPKLIALGTSGLVSFWQVVALPELISTKEFLFTLKARNAFGVLPHINESRLPSRGKEKLIETVEVLIDAAHRADPASVIDRARAAAQYCLGAWAADHYGDDQLLTKDLADIIKKTEKDKRTATRAAEIVRVLHSNAKPNEQERHGSRPPMEDDAELAVKAVALIIRELGWESV